MKGRDIVREISTVTGCSQQKLKEATVVLPRYIAVGISGVVIGMVAIWCFTELLGFLYLVSGCFSGFLSILNDFTFNEIWTFSQGRRRPRSIIELVKRFAKFIVSRAAGFLICIAVLVFLTQVVGFHYLISNLFAIGASFVWNYTTSTFWVWARRK